MASNKTLELQAMTDEDLRGQLEQSVAAYDKMKFDHSVNGIDQPLRLRESRRDIALCKLNYVAVNWPLCLPMNWLSAIVFNIVVVNLKSSNL